MKRKIEEHLLKWKNDTNKRPLMIYGNKQVGKTYSLEKNIIKIRFTLIQIIILNYIKFLKGKELLIELYLIYPFYLVNLF